MSDIVKLLPDSVANQIAAGEVIQRPASLVKELMENAIDSGAGKIHVIIKDAGRTLVQVVDDGCGMSAADAGLAFQRHATSKIAEAKDLFSIRTLGFRGEALASIAAVAEVELKTRRFEDELGTLIRISASEIHSEEPVSCPTGSNFLVKNLFFNVPARRKFLKSDTTEYRHIVNEFYRVVLSNPDISFSLSHNGSEIYKLPASQVKQRIINVFGKNMNQVLIPVSNETSIVNLRGFIGKPESAKKSFGEQFFFINNRYMRHPYFHKAIVSAYEQVLPPDTIPSYYIYFEADTGSIDINIHPTKTEVKFEDERSVYQILHATTREALGKHSMVPSLDFGSSGDIDIPILNKDTPIRVPEERINPEYNPFEEENKYRTGSSTEYRAKQENLSHWESLYRDLDKAEQSISRAMEENTGSLGEAGAIMQFKQKYILLAVKSGLMMVDQVRAHERILYETFLASLSEEQPVAQQELYPQRIELDAAEFALFMEIIDDICNLGFDVRESGDKTIEIKGIPAGFEAKDPAEWMEGFISDYKDRGADPKEKTNERLAASMAKNSSIRGGKVLKQEEMREIMDQLFACKEPGVCPDGRAVFKILQMEDIEKLFN
jgi:DNA mismatch repair protein MutL